MEAFQPTMIASFPRTYVELATGDLPVKGAAKVHSWFNTADSAHYGHIRRLVTLGERPAGLIKPWLLPSDRPARRPLAGSQYVDGLGSSEMGMANFGEICYPGERAQRPLRRQEAGEVYDAAVSTARATTSRAARPGCWPCQVTPSLTPGYWNNPAPDQVLRGSTDTGSPATSPTATQRATSTISTARSTSSTPSPGPVYTLQLEEVLIADVAEYVQDCSVFGVPGPDGGQVPAAVVRLQAGAEEAGVTEETVLEAANKQLADAGRAPLAALRIARTAADYPLGPTGKVLKRELRTRFATLLGSPPDGTRYLGAALPLRPDPAGRSGLAAAARLARRHRGPMARPAVAAVAQRQEHRPAAAGHGRPAVGGLLRRPPGRPRALRHHGDPGPAADAQHHGPRPAAGRRRLPGRPRPPLPAPGGLRPRPRLAEPPARPARLAPRGRDVGGRGPDPPVPHQGAGRAGRPPARSTAGTAPAWTWSAPRPRRSPRPASSCGRTTGRRRCSTTSSARQASATSWCPAATSRTSPGRGWRRSCSACSRSSRSGTSGWPPRASSACRSTGSSPRCWRAWPAWPAPPRRAP